MRVLHLIDSGGLYGAERMLLALVKAQLDQGLAPMILSAGDPTIEEKPLEAEARRLGLPFTAWRMKPGFNVREGRKILNWARSNDYDLLHSHGYKFNLLLGIYPKVLRRIPLITTLHGYVHARRFSKLWLYEVVDRFTIVFVQGIALVGEAMRKELPARLSKSQKVKVIPNGLDIDAISQQMGGPVERKIEEFLARHSPVVLGVGRLSQEKGFDRLIEAFHALDEKFENSGLLIVGEGKQRDYLEKRVNELGLQDKVSMPGYCSSVPSLLSRADLLVIPSHTEGLPIALLEAMAVGVLVLVSPVGEMPNVLGYGDGGYVLPENSDTTVFGTLIVEALSDGLGSEKLKWSLEKVTSTYSAVTMERSYRELYSSALAFW